MNLLFDFITVRVKTGAGEYQRRVLFELLSYIVASKAQINLYALYDSTWGIAYEDLREDTLGMQCAIQYIDCKDRSISKIVDEYKIDRFFIACGHYYREHPEVADVKCDVVAVIHDFYGEDNFYNKIYLYSELVSPTAEKKITLHRFRMLRNLPVFKTIFDKFDTFSFNYFRKGGNKKYEDLLGHLTPMINLIKNNKNVKLVTVSESSNYSYLYHFGNTKITPIVLYSPERIEVEIKDIQNPGLSQLVKSKTKYYLMVSANREMKNQNKLLAAFKQFSEQHQDAYLVTLGMNNKMYKNHIPLGFLSDSDLAQAYMNCYALVFPSYYEGFGYPPIEAMHYGKPVLCSNTTSMPEILGEAPLYFSPFYESSIYASLCRLTSDNYEMYSARSFKQYSIIQNRQKSDLQTLIKMIIKAI